VRSAQLRLKFRLGRFLLAAIVMLPLVVAATPVSAASGALTEMNESGCGNFWQIAALGLDMDADVFCNVMEAGDRALVSIEGPNGFHKVLCDGLPFVFGGAPDCVTGWRGMVTTPGYYAIRAETWIIIPPDPNYPDFYGWHGVSIFGPVWVGVGEPSTTPNFGQWPPSNGSSSSTPPVVDPPTSDPLDTSAPTVIAKTRGSALGRRPTIRVVFDEAVVGASRSTVRIKDASSGRYLAATVRYNATTHAVTIVPRSLLRAHHRYTIVLRSIADTSGNVASIIAWTITTRR
jgi:hypothetical protein